MIDPDESPPYHVVPEDGQFHVVDWEGNSIVACSDAANAEQYAALMSQSFRSGYKAGFRKAKRK